MSRLGLFHSVYWHTQRACASPRVSGRRVGRSQSQTVFHSAPPQVRLADVSCIEPNHGVLPAEAATSFAGPIEALAKRYRYGRVAVAPRSSPMKSGGSARLLRQLGSRGCRAGT